MASGPPPTDMTTAAVIDVERDGALLQPTRSVVDFYESLESMRVRLSDAVVAGPTSHAGGKSEVVLAPRGSFGPLTSRATPRLTERDLHGERVVVVGPSDEVPDMDAGDTLAAPVSGVIDYADGSFRVGRRRRAGAHRKRRRGPQSGRGCGAR